MKSCLKCTTDSQHSYGSPPDSPSEQGSDCDIPSSMQRRKSVTFSEVGEEDIFYVDDWDRSPAAVTERLTYQCVPAFCRARIRSCGPAPFQGCLRTEGAANSPAANATRQAQIMTRARLACCQPAVSASARLILERAHSLCPTQTTKHGPLDYIGVGYGHFRTL